MWGDDPYVMEASVTLPPWAGVLPAVAVLIALAALAAL